MTSKRQTAATTLAIQAVQRLAKNKDISPLVRALTLSLLPRIPELAGTQKHLQSQLDAALTPEYILGSDLSELFSILYVLSSENKAFSGEEMAGIVKRLLAAEQEEGGPYRSDDGRIDLLTNAYIGAFIRKIAQPLPKLEMYIKAQALHYDFTYSAYTSYSAAYLLAKVYPNNEVDDFLYTDQSTSPQSLALELLMRSSGDESAAVAALLERQLSDGSWPAEEFIKGQYSKLLTTTLILRSLVKDVPGKVQAAAVSGLEKELHGDIICKGFQIYDQTAEPLRTNGQHSIAQVIQADKQHEITLLPFYFAKALDLAMDTKAIEKYRLLGLANVLCWIAYTTYDHLLDDEGDPHFLSSANVAHRASLAAYSQALGVEDDFLLYIYDGFLGMDETNAWELKHCRYKRKHKRIFLANLPDFAELDVLANRSFGHVLGPLALVHTCVDATIHQKKAIESALRHYLIARQLNDDIHDWQADMKKGHISYAVASILRELAVPPGAYDMSRLLHAMRLCFWSRTLPKIVTRILMHTRQARDLLNDSRLIVHSSYIWPFIDKLEVSARVALNTQMDSHDFLRAYQDSPVTGVRSSV